MHFVPTEAKAGFCPSCTCLTQERVDDGMGPVREADGLFEVAVDGEVVAEMTACRRLEPLDFDPHGAGGPRRGADGATPGAAETEARGAVAAAAKSQRKLCLMCLRDSEEGLEADVVGAALLARQSRAVPRREERLQLEPVAKSLFHRSLALVGLVSWCRRPLAWPPRWCGCPLVVPILLRQTRPGSDGAPFELLKFRTMQVGESRMRIRLTGVGRFLRRWSLDELPELWNVLRGDMSLVGPRPLLMQYLGRYSPRQARRHEVRPGITGWAQVNGRNALSWEEKLELDVWYVDNWSLWLDLRILGRTLWQVIRREGISHEGSATMPEFEGRVRAGMSERLPLYVFGAGGHGKVVAEAARASVGFALLRVPDDDPERQGQTVLGLPVDGGLEVIDGAPGPGGGGPRRRPQSRSSGSAGSAPGRRAVRGERASPLGRRRVQCAAWVREPTSVHSRWCTPTPVWDGPAS